MISQFDLSTAEIVLYLIQLEQYPSEVFYYKLMA